MYLDDRRPDDGADLACRLGLGALAADKHIPAGYLRASEPQRRDLLAGLLDTAGTVTATAVRCTSSTVTAAGHRTSVS